MTGETIDESTERSSVVVLGRLLGTATDCETVNEFASQFIDFEAAPAFAEIPNGNLGVNFLTGNFDILDSEGNVLQSVDMIEILSKHKTITEEEIERLMEDDQS